jgi:hypothetical protein
MLDAWVIVIDESTPNLREETLEELKCHTVEVKRARLE